LLYLIAIIPWVLTVGALLFIISRNVEIEEDEDFDMDEEYQTTHVAVFKDKAYWVHDNVFYESETTREPDFTTARPIDTMSMSPKDLNKLLIILDELEEYRKE
jgi:pectate lyase